MSTLIEELEEARAFSSRAGDDEFACRLRARIARIHDTEVWAMVLAPESKTTFTELTGPLPSPDGGRE